MLCGLLRNLRLSASACCLVAISTISPVLAQESEIAQEPACVTADGDQLFEVTRVLGFTAMERAEKEDVEAVHRVEDGRFGPQIIFGDAEIIVMIEKDAALECINSDTLTEVRGQVIAEAIKAFRERCSEFSLEQSWQVSASWTGVFSRFAPFLSSSSTSHSTTQFDAFSLGFG